MRERNEAKMIPEHPEPRDRAKQLVAARETGRSEAENLDRVPLACYTAKPRGSRSLTDSVAPSPGNWQQASGTLSRSADGYAATF